MYMYLRNTHMIPLLPPPEKKKKKLKQKNSWHRPSSIIWEKGSHAPNTGAGTFRWY